MRAQEKLIGKHHLNGTIYARCLSCDDKPASARKKHRELSEIAGTRDELIDQLSEWLIHHHLSDIKKAQFEKKKKILEKHDLQEFLKRHQPFPTSDRTKKGNATEVLLAEYLAYTTRINLLVYRLRYNPNVDQAMKGDDVLLINKANVRKKIIVGESKFRTTPTKSSIKEIVANLEGDKRFPVSISFIANQLEQAGKLDLAEQIEELNTEMHQLNVPIVNAGLLLSNEDTSAKVETHLDSANDSLVFLSLGIANPEDLISRSFEEAERKLTTE
jgi:hypothetical protein